MAHKFHPDNWKRLESAERRVLLPPRQVLDKIGLTPGQVIADIGAGTGYFAIPAAELVGPNGKVFAVDISQQMLDMMAERLEGTDLPIELVHSREIEVPLDDGSADHVFTSTVLHEIDPGQRVAFLTELARLLKPSGRLTVLDWAPTDVAAMGPPSHIRLTKNEVEGLLAAARLSLFSSSAFGSEFYIVQGIRRDDMARRE